MDDRKIIFKVPVFPQLVFRCNIIRIRIPTRHFLNVQTSVLQFTREKTRSWEYSYEEQRRRSLEYL